MDFTKSLFGGIQTNTVPVDAKVIVVADFFKEDLIGGAELTTEAIIEKSPVKIHKIRSQELTVNTINENTDKYWIITNFAGIRTDVLVTFIQNPNVRYSIVEYDFKYCIHRSPFKHFLVDEGKPCDCMNTNHGAMIKLLYTKAEKLFWMAEKQRDHYLGIWPELNAPGKNIVQTSTFSDQTLNTLKMLRLIHNNSAKSSWAVQVSNSWIKGSKETMQWAQRHGLNTQPLGNMSYDQFLIELAKCKGLIFRPLDSDTCPRVVIEAKLLGLDLKLNKHVLHAEESWFTGTIEETEEYLRSRGPHFWSHIKL